MDILNFIMHFVANIFIAMFSLSCWLKFTKINKSIISKILIIILLAASITTINYIFSNPIKMLANFIILFIINYFLITEKINLSIISVMISQIILATAEFSFAVILSFIYTKDVQEVAQDPIIFLIMNVYIIMFSFLILLTKLPYKIYRILSNLSTKNKKNNNESLIYSIIIIFVTFFYTTESYINLPLSVVLISNIIMAIVFISIIIGSTTIKDNYNKISSKYETSISMLKEYEIMIDKFRVNTHENKNEFLTIRNMVKDDPNETVKYIDQLINNKIKDNDKIMKQTAKIPKGGLRATIYSKLCLMDKLKIKYNLNISRDVHTTDLIGLDEDLILKICKILGVFLDNAIEAVNNLRKKEINIEIYITEKYLCIDITNNFKGNINLNRIDDIKYTTKEEGHGYGLTLVNKILCEEMGKLENEKRISGDTFTQTLKIKM